MRPSVYLCLSVCVRVCMRAWRGFRLTVDADALDHAVDVLVGRVDVELLQDGVDLGGAESTLRRVLVEEAD